MKLQIHATNINGLGASQVVKSFLDSCEKLDYLIDAKIYLPEHSGLSNYKSEKGKCINYNRFFPNGISRIIETLFSRFYFENIPTIVLGDIPLRGIENQIVLVHQPNLIYPRVNKYSSKGMIFRINRLIFSLNIKYAKNIIVQTGAMADEMIQSYPKIKNKMLVVPQPVPNWFSKAKFVDRENSKSHKIILFYPAAFYPHKKHQFIHELYVYCYKQNINFSDFEIWFTLSKDDFEQFKEIPFLKNLGKLDTEQMIDKYKKADALLFLSSMESYGLPLVEALTIHIPIIAPNLKYARWMCEDSAFYFEPYNVKSFLLTLEHLKHELKNNEVHHSPIVLKKFPISWESVASAFFNSLS